jgi:hypothetical protein
VPLESEVPPPDVLDAGKYFSLDMDTVTCRRSLRIVVALLLQEMCDSGGRQFLPDLPGLAYWVRFCRADFPGLNLAPSLS